MSSSFELRLAVTVVDEEAVMQAAVDHLASQGIEASIDDPAEAVRILLDPGSDLWTMDLLKLGLSIDDSSCQRVAERAAAPVGPDL